MSETETTDNAFSHMPGPGPRLQAARESKSLTIETVATQLKLTRGTVQALESEQWDALHARTYARGYFVIYVKFLGLPMDELLAQFNAQYTEPETSSVRVSAQSVSDDRPFPWLPVSLLVSVLIVCLLAYQHWSDNQQSTSEPDAITTAPNAVDTAPQDTQLDTDLIAPMARSTLNNEAQPQGNELAADIRPETSRFEPVEIDLDVLEQSREPSVNPAPDGPVEQLALANEAMLTMRFDEDSWVEVEDANTQVLISRVVSSGETISLVGAAPLSVQLGKAQGVEVFFNEQRVDISDDIVGNVARFTLGG